MSKYNIPENNSLKKEIEELIRLCKKAEEEYGENSSIFAQGIEENEMTDWEEKNGITIPESYKEWLRFSALCKIRQTLAMFNPPKEFHSKYVPEDYIVIGSMIGDGEIVCFSKETGEFVRFYNGRENGRVNNFKIVLKEINSHMRGDNLFTPERKAEILAKLKKMRENGEL